MTMPTTPPAVELVAAEELLYEFEALKAEGRLDPWGFPIDAASWPLRDMRGWMYLNVHLDARNFRVIYDLVDPASTRGCSARYNVDNIAKLPRLVEAIHFAKGGVLPSAETRSSASAPEAYRVDVDAWVVRGKPLAWKATVRYLVENDLGELVYVPLLFGTTKTFTRKGLKRSYSRIIEHHKRENTTLRKSDLAQTIYLD